MLTLGPSKTIARFGIREAKDHMSQLLRRVEAGQEVEITRRSKVVARIVPANFDQHQ